MANPYLGLNIISCNSPAIGADKTTYSGVFDTSFQKVDEHDHTTSKGVQIPNGGIADGAIGASKLGSGSVTTVKIADGNVTPAKLSAAVLPPGLIMEYGAASAPAGWLLCDGTAVSRTTYAALFAIIATTFGVGDGSSTFNVPDLRGRAPMGAGTGSGLTARTLGTTVGEENHTLSSTEMPSHTHVQDAHGHSVSDPGHTHLLPLTGVNKANGVDGGAYTSGAAVDNPTSGSRVTGLTVVVATAMNQNTGGGAAHNVIHPSLVVNFVIKT